MPSATILIVEDNSNVRLALTTFLKMKGFEVREAGSCADARDMISAPDLAVTITDLNLPDGKGDELLASARHPVIAMTGHVDDQTRVRLLEQGFAAFLPKPATLDQVLVAVEKALEPGALH